MTNKEVVEHFIQNKFGSAHNRRFNLAARRVRPTGSTKYAGRRGILETRDEVGNRTLLAVRYSDGSIIVSNAEYERHQKKHKNDLLKLLDNQAISYILAEQEVVDISAYGAGGDPNKSQPPFITNLTYNQAATF